MAAACVQNAATVTLRGEPLRQARAVIDDKTNGSAPATSGGERRIAFERLRERTDELELIISGISLVALVSLPSWMFERMIAIEAHVEGARASLVAIGLHLAIGLSYTLAGAFLVHLAVRAYWVGLIGLKAAFPEGIRWPNIRSLGPVASGLYRNRLIGLDDAIDRADRAASIVFMLVSVVAISTLWMGTLLVLLLGIAILGGTLFNDPDAGARRLLFGLGVLVLIAPIAVGVLDRGVMRRIRPDGTGAKLLTPLVAALVRAQDFLLPQRFLLPVQLSLESNLPRHTFAILFGTLVATSAMIGGVPGALAPQFAMFDSYHYLDDDEAAAGLRSAHYENLRGADDRVLRLPMIASDMVAESYLRVFLPYLPRRDNAVLRERCADPAAAGAAGAGPACIATLWTLQLDGAPIETGDFVGSERRDIGLRGLQGYIAMDGLRPGRHELTVTWNAQGGETRRKHPRTYRIPFWFAPPYQLDLAPAALPEVPAK